MDPLELEALRKEAQEALEELWKARAIPFKLTAYVVRPGLTPGFYRVLFYDSRLPLAEVQPDHGKPFKDTVKEAVLKCISDGRSVITTSRIGGAIYKVLKVAPFSATKDTSPPGLALRKGCGTFSNNVRQRGRRVFH